MFSLFDKSSLVWMSKMRFSWWVRLSPKGVILGHNLRETLNMWYREFRCFVIIKGRLYHRTPQFQPNHAKPMSYAWFFGYPWISCEFPIESHEIPFLLMISPPFSKHLPATATQLRMDHAAAGFKGYNLMLEPVTSVEFCGYGCLKMSYTPSHGHSNVKIWEDAGDKPSNLEVPYFRPLFTHQFV